MNITIDCRMLGSSGIGVYLEGCLPYFLESPHQFLLLGDKEKILPLTGKRTNFSVEQCTVKPFSPAELFLFPARLQKKINQCDLYYSPYFNIPGGIKAPVCVTIHDIIFADMPELVSCIGLRARMFFYKRAARRSACIFTVSGFSKSRIEYHLGKKKPVINASNAVKPPDVTAYPKNISKKRSILFIGNIKKHKGLGILLNAFLRARNNGLNYNLVIVGSKDNFRSMDRESSARLEQLDKKSVSFTGFIPDAEKWRLLAESALLVQPSLYEGFGYPPLEAMLAGTPALISDIPVFRETYGDFPVTFFKAGDSEDLKVKMMEILNNRNLQALILTSFLKERYTFKKTSKIILEGWQNYGAIFDG